MLAIGMALMRKPKVLLLDEIATDLAPLVVNQVLASWRVEGFIRKL